MFFSGSVESTFTSTGHSCTALTPSLSLSAPARNSIPPTTTPANLSAKLSAASGQCHVDVAFWGGVVPDNAASLRPLVGAGLPGFKCFLIHSGVDEFPHVTADQVETALQQLQGTGAVLLVGERERAVVAVGRD